MVKDSEILKMNEQIQTMTLEAEADTGRHTRIWLLINSLANIWWVLFTYQELLWKSDTLL